MPESDWSQFVPDLIVAIIGGLFLLIVGGSLAYFKSDKFKKWFNRLLNKMMLAIKWLVANWRLVVLHSIVVILGVIFFRTYIDWKIVAFAIICYLVGLFSWRFTGSLPMLFGRKTSPESKTRFIPLSLTPGPGNSYLNSRYIAPPFGDVSLGNAQFRLEPDSLIFDTNKQIRYYLPRSDGGKEIDFKLLEPQNQIKSVYFLINSGNSKSIYANNSIGEIRLLFKDAPPIIVELVLGQNIREWCPGNPGDFVREVSDPMVTMDVWTGLSKSGATAVIDCLKIPVNECMRNCFLEKIIIVHKSPQHPQDTMGVHFSIFAVSLEIKQRMRN